MLIKIFRIILALTLLAPTYAMANQKVVDCVGDQLPPGYKDYQVILYRCDLTAEDMPALVAILNQYADANLDVEFYDNDMGGGGIGDRGLKILSTLKNLKKLSVEGNHITDEGVKYLVDTGIEDLDLDNNYITSNGAKILSKIDSIYFLDIGRNFIGDSGAIALAASKIGAILVPNNHIGIGGAMAFAGNNYIHLLDLSSNDIGEKSFVALLQNPNIKSLVVMRCGIGDESMSALAKNKTLELIALDSNNITDVGAALFATTTSTTYNRIFLTYNLLRRSGKKALKDRFGDIVILDDEIYPGPDGSTIATKGNIISRIIEETKTRKRR